MEAILVLDVGTSSMRGILFDQEGKRLAVKQSYYSPEFLENDKVEQAPDTWLSCANTILHYFANQEQISIACIACTSGRSSVIPVDGKGRALSNAIMWHDRRTVPIVDTYQDSDTHIYNTTGIRFCPLTSAPKILWIKEHQPEVYKNTQYFLGIQDFLIHHLTGEFVTDYTFGSRTALMNIQKNQWEQDLLDLFGIDPQKLCTLIPPATICGGLNSTVSKLTGIPAGTPVLSAGGDQQCAAIGQGLHQEKHMVVNTGTGAYVLQGSPKIILDPQRGVFCTPSSIQGQYFLEASIITAGILYHRFVTLFYKDSKENTHGVNNIIGDSPPGANGLVLFPWFEGRGAPFWNPRAAGSLFNLSLRTSRADILRALIEAIALDIAENKERMESLMGKPNQVYITGGMSTATAYNQILADCLNITLARSKNQESTSEGAWIIAAKATGVCAEYSEAYEKVKQESTYIFPNEHNHVLYQTMLEKRKAMYASACSNDYNVQNTSK